MKQSKGHVHIKLKALGYLIKYIPQGEKELVLDETTSLKKLKIKIGIPQNCSIGYVVNGIVVKEDYVLNNGDHITFVMLISGG